MAKGNSLGIVKRLKIEIIRSKDNTKGGFIVKEWKKINDSSRTVAHLMLETFCKKKKTKETVVYYLDHDITNVSLIKLKQYQLC